MFRSILLGATTPRSQYSKLSKDFFYQKHDLSGLIVLDPFVGGGTTLVEAAKCNASVIGVDIDPVACFVTSKELHPANESLLLEAFSRVAAECKDTLTSWYRTTLSNGSSGTIVYSFWVDLIRCPDCKLVSEAHPHYQLSRSKYYPKHVVFCSYCGEVGEIPKHWEHFSCQSCGRRTDVGKGPIHKGKFTCPQCSYRGTFHSIATGGRRLKQRMFALEVLPDGEERTVFKKANAKDQALYTKASRAWRERKRIDRFVPTDTIPIKNRVDRRPVLYGYRKYSDLFNDRQLLCLSTLADSIAHIQDVASREFLATAFSDCLAANNMFCFYAFDYQKLTPLFGLHAYHKVNRPVENNVWGAELGRGSFTKCFNKLLRAKRYGAAPFEYRYSQRSHDPKQVKTGESIKTVLVDSIPQDLSVGSPFGILLNQSSEKLGQISNGTVDLILSDPPYYDNIAYSELSDFYHVWLKRLRLPSYKGNSQTRTPLHESLYVRNNKDHNSEHIKFADGLKKVIRECHRVLKDKGLFVFTFHHKNWRAWSSLGSALFHAGFDITNVFPVRSEGQSQFHSAAGNLKWDAVFCCRKRQTGESVNPFVALKARKRAANEVSRWEAELRPSKLKLGPADRASIRCAFYLKALLNCFVDPLAAEMPVFAKGKRVHKS